MSLPDFRDPVGWLIDLLDAVGSHPLRASQRQCPAHPDSSPSLSIMAGRTGVAVIHCHAGCPTRRIMAALRCPMARLFTPGERPAALYARLLDLHITFPPLTHGRGGSPASRGFRLVAIHDYGPAVLYRWRNGGGKKELFWETRTPRGDVPGLLGVPLTDLPLYREREIRMAMAINEWILVVESESSVDALRGFYATTWAGGASAPNVARLHDVLGGAERVALVPDNDAAGLACLLLLHAALPQAKIILPEPGQDAKDLFEAIGPGGLTNLLDEEPRG